MGRAVREVQGPWRTAPLTARTHRPRGRAAVDRRVAVAAIVAIDQLTKSWAVSRARRRPARHHRRLRRSSSSSRNGGSAFSRFQGIHAGPRGRSRSSIVGAHRARGAQRDRSAGCSIGLTLVLGGALGNLVRPDLPRRRASCAATSSTSSRSAGSRCSTSPTRASRSARSSSIVRTLVRADGRAGDDADVTPMTRADRGPGRARRRAGRPRGRAAHRLEPRRRAGAARRRRGPRRRARGRRRATACTRARSSRCSANRRPTRRPTPTPTSRSTCATPTTTSSSSPSRPDSSCTPAPATPTARS